MELLVDNLPAIATTFAGIFGGTCLYVTAVGHPVRYDAPVEGLKSFRKCLPLSERMQPLFHAISLAATIAWIYTAKDAAVITPMQRQLRLAGLCAIGPIVPFTLAFILPINTTLRDTKKDFTVSETLDGLKRWGKMHGVRTTLAVLGFVLLNFSR